MMNKISNQKIIFLVIILFTFVLTGCKNAMNSEIGESSTIKIATLPVIDTLPMYVADTQYFSVSTKKMVLMSFSFPQVRHRNGMN